MLKETFVSLEGKAQALSQYYSLKTNVATR